MEYGGIKVFEIPIHYFEPQVKGETDRKSWHRIYGLSFSGDYLAAFLVKELVAGLLGYIQGLGGPAIARFENLCDFVGDFHSHFFREIKGHLGAGQNLEFFFGGFCPVAQCVRVARFEINPVTRDSLHKEILTRPHGESYETLGSANGCYRFKQLFDLSLSGQQCRVHYAILRRLRDVILDTSMPEIAGAIQYGEFGEDGNFRLLGTGMIEMGQFAPEIRFFVRGTNVDPFQKVAASGLYLGYKALLPFDDDVQSFDPRQIYWRSQGNPVILDELITLLPSESQWTRRFKQERRALKTVLPGVRSIEHVGSTAVPALPAVPIIDILVGVNSPDSNDAIIKKMAAIGYVYLGPHSSNSLIPFRKRTGQAANVSIVVFEGAYWNDCIALREYLRSHPLEAETYGKDKARLLNTGGWTLYRYNNLKIPVLIAILIKARSWYSTTPRQLHWTQRWRKWF